MAHFARINADGSVGLVLVVSNDDCGGGNFPESEPIGQAFLASLGLDGEWKQTSYSGAFRGHYAGNNYYFDAVKDEFVLVEVKEVADVSE